jgi:hypothetical protein
MSLMTPPPARQVVEHAYAAFNAHDLAGALSAMHPDVEWSDDVDGRTVHGRDEVGDYWTRQWTVVDPHADPLRIDDDDDGRLIVAVHQIVRNRSGLVVAERFVEHAYLVEDGLIRRMEIRATSGRPVLDASWSS